MDGGGGIGRGGRGAATLAFLADLEKRRLAARDDQAETEPQPGPSRGLPIGRGRAGALQMALQQMQKPREEATAAPAPNQPPAPVPAVGRGAMLQHLLSLSKTTAPPPKSSGPALPPLGRAAALARGLCQLKLEGATASAQVEQPPPSPSASQMSDSSKTSAVRSLAEPVVRRGEDGTKIRMVANYIRLNVEHGRGVFEYATTFNPQIDSIGHRRRLISNQQHVFGRTRSFDGGKLYLPTRLPQSMTVLTGEHPVDSSPVTIYVKYIRQQPIEDCIHLYNLLFRRIMKILKYTLVGRSYFDSHGGIPIPQHKLEIWPGYVTSVQRYEGGLMLMCDASHRVLRSQTVFEIMADLMVTRPRDWRDEVTKILIGSSVLTRYNNKNYRIDEILWDQNPKSTFQSHTGEEISFVDYYKKAYDIDILDRDQPLLLHRAKPARGQTEHKNICLVPELANVTGQTDDMRKDFRVMKDVASHTRLTPNQRKLAYEKFLKNIQTNEQAREVLTEWGLHLDQRPVTLDGRILRREEIILGQRTIQVNDKFDWGFDLTREKVFLALEFRVWSVIFARQNSGKASEFVEMFMKVCPSMGMACNRPNMVRLDDDRNDSYLRAIRSEANTKHGSDKVQIIVTICPTSRDDRYAAIKKICYIDLAMPSQVINVRTISMPGKLRSVAQKVALQMNCKIGGELWSLKVPLKDLMVVGIDVYHDGGKKGRSVLGFVSSMNRALTRWHSKVAFQEVNQEISDSLQMCMMAAVTKWHEVNHCLPKRIVVFRDGVGDGQLRVVQGFEIEQLKKSFLAFGENFQPMLSVVVVQKRTNTRLMAVKNQGLDNPSSGGILDHTVTRYDMYDFFLISQQLTQGTASPTHYIVLHDESGLQPDHMQRLTYKMTYMYFNWPGTVSVPAPCQYAHKLAQMSGQHLHKLPDAAMSDTLFFL